ncbi:MAG: succinate dehydrogenase [Hyphomicrobiaceae bacterium]
MNVRLYTLQRLSALIMVPLIIGHLIVIFYATRKGLTAGDVLARTRGSFLWGSYYALFVLAAAVHGAIGVRSVAREWGRMVGRNLDLLMWGAGLVLAGLGLRAVWAVVIG